MDVCLSFAASLGAPGEQQSGHNYTRDSATCHLLWYLSGASRLFSHLDYYNTLISAPASASAPSPSLFSRPQPEGSFKTSQMVSFFAQKHPWLPMSLRVKASVLRVACKAPVVPPDPSATFPSAFPAVSTGFLPVLQASKPLPECPLCLGAGPPQTRKPLPSASFILCSNVTFLVRPSRTTGFPSPRSSFLFVALTC